MDKKGESLIMIKVAIAGARGRMGTEALQTVIHDQEMTVIAVLDYKFDDMYLNNNEVTTETDGIPIYTSLVEMCKQHKPDVLLDVTNPKVVFRNSAEALKLGIRPVIGTSGLSSENIEHLSELAKVHQIGAIIAPNFSIGAVLMMKFSAMAARYLGDVEILEMHHNNKVDAPSGTAVKTAEMIQEVRQKHHQGHVDEKEILAGARGADVDGLKIHSIRLPGLLAHQEVLLGGTGELLTIRHDSFDRSCFMEGIKLAIRQVMDKNELIYGLENIVD